MWIKARGVCRHGGHVTTTDTSHETSCPCQIHAEDTHAAKLGWEAGKNGIQTIANNQLGHHIPKEAVSSSHWSIPSLKRQFLTKENAGLGWGKVRR